MANRFREEVERVDLSCYCETFILQPLDLPPMIKHPSTSSLANDLLVDPDAFQQNYNGIYDESGDYVPQYCDNPDDIPRGSLVANEETPPNPVSVGDDDSPKVSTSNEGT